MVSEKEVSTAFIKPGDTAFIQYTSGSTNLPKGVIVTHANLLNNAEFAKKSFGFHQDCAMVSWLPPFHDMGLIGGIFTPLYVGMKAYLMAPMAFIKRPGFWLKTISNIKVANNGFICSGAPNFAYDYCLKRIPESLVPELNLRNWKIAYSGAEFVKPQTLKRFAKFFEKAGFTYNSFYPVYGLAEATLLVSAGNFYTNPIIKTFDTELLKKGIAAETQNNTNEKTIDIVACGHKFQNEVVIVDESKKVLPENCVGEILVAASSVCKGYLNKPDITKETFHVKLEEFPDKLFLSTGDLGFINDEHLYIKGRKKDLIIIRGKNYYPADLEASFEGCHKLLRNNASVCFSIDTNEGEELIIVQETHKQASNTEEYENIVTEINKIVSLEFSLKPFDVVLTPSSTIPKTTSGKIQRLKSKDLYLSNGFNKKYSIR